MLPLPGRLLNAWIAASAPTMPGGHGFTFEWDAAAGCPDEDRVIAHIFEFLGEAPAVSGGQTLKIRVGVVRTSDGWFEGRVANVHSGEQSKLLRFPSCEEVAEGAAHHAAMMIEAPQDGRGRAGVAPVAPPPRATRRDKLRGALRIAVGEAHNDLPGFAALIRLTGALRWRRVHLELETSYEPLLRARFVDRPGTGANFLFVAGAVRACPTLTRRRFEIPLCVGLEAGTIRGQGVNLADDARSIVGFAAVQLAPAVRFAPHPRVAVGAAVEGAFRLTRPTLVIEGWGRHPLPFQSVRILASVEVRFL